MAIQHSSPMLLNPTPARAAVGKYQRFGEGGKAAMTSEPLPIVGAWYQNDLGESFEIVAQDEDDETLELQYYDGTLEELDRETWESMNPQKVEPPEDWTASMDVSREDVGGPDIWPETVHWLSEIDRIE